MRDRPRLGASLLAAGLAGLLAPPLLGLIWMLGPLLLARLSIEPVAGGSVIHLNWMLILIWVACCLGLVAVGVSKLRRKPSN